MPAIVWLTCSTNISASKESAYIEQNELSNGQLILRLYIGVFLYDYRLHKALISAINFCANSSASATDFASV